MTIIPRRNSGLLVAAVLLIACGTDTTAPPEPLRIETRDVEDARVDVPYTAGIVATGGRLEYEWDVVAGALPPGLALTFEDLPDGDDVLIAGSPEEVGTYAFTLQVTSADGQTDTEGYTLRVLPMEELAIANVVLPPALRGGPYEVRLRPVGGPSNDYEWSITAGSLPDGLALTAEGTIEGTPTSTDTVSLTLQLESGPETTSRTFQLQVVANRTTTYDITWIALSPIPATVLPHVEDAIAEWEEVITADLIGIHIPTSFLTGSHCAGFGQELNGTTIDDILIMVNIAEIDGPGEILGQAGPCAVRDSSQLPVGGVLVLDSEDLELIATSVTARHIIAHEIGHVLGFGSLWGAELLEGRGSSDPRFLGSAAVAEWHALGGEGNVPVENEGGQGTANSHWRETVFDTELMTGFSEPPGVFQPMSRVTIGSMEDLGYSVDYAAADSFSLGTALFGPGAMRGNLGYDILLDTPPVPIAERPAPVRTDAPGRQP